MKHNWPRPTCIVQSGNHHVVPGFPMYCGMWFVCVCVAGGVGRLFGARIDFFHPYSSLTYDVHMIVGYIFHYQ